MYFPIIALVLIFTQESQQLFDRGANQQNPLNVMAPRYGSWTDEIKGDKYLNYYWNAGIAQWNKMYPGSKASDDQLAVLVYTGPEFYSTFNKLLAAWFKNPKTPFQYKGYFAQMMRRLVQMPAGFTCYRGETWLATFKTNEVIHSDQFESCSYDSKVAVSFFKGTTNTLFIISTKTGLPVIDVKGLSYYPKEKEYIIPPGLNFQVIGAQPPNKAQPYQMIWLQKI